MLANLLNVDALHPLMVHFPIALLLVAPVFVILAIAWKRNELPISITALILMALGTIGAFVAAASGEAAEDNVSGAAARAVLDRHEDLATTVEITFSALTLLFAALLFLPRLFHHPLRRLTMVSATIVFLGLYLAGAILLAVAAHQGGRLVHEFGVRSPVTALIPGT